MGKIIFPFAVDFVVFLNILFGNPFLKNNLG